jgi:hypothetical protein
MNKLQRKFENYLESLSAAAAGEFDLRDNYKLYNKVHRFYSKEGVNFSGDAALDYSLVMSYLSEDLTN